MMQTFFYNRHKDTGEPHRRTGMSSAPHLYTSAKKAAAQVGDTFEQVEVLTLEVVDGKPRLTPAQAQEIEKAADAMGVETTQEGDMVATFEMSVIELHLFIERVLAAK